MQKQFFKTFFLLVIFFMLPNFAHAKDYWIDPLNGNDANVGSQALPKLNLNSTALRNSLQPGDNIILMDTAVYAGAQGFYGGSGFGADGTKDNPITIKAAPGAHPVFKGCGQYQVYITLQRQWYVVDGITFDLLDDASQCSGAKQITTDVLVQGSNDVVQNCITKIVPSAAVTISNADNNTVQNNVISNVGSFGDVSTGMGVGDAITLLGAQNNIIQNNIINGSGHAAIDSLDYSSLTRLSSHNQIIGNTIDQGVKAGSQGGGGGIYLALQTSFTSIEGNDISNIGQMPGIIQNKAGIDVTGSHDNIIENNRIESYGYAGNESHRGIYLNSTDSGFSDLNETNNLFENNFIGAGYGVPVYIREGVGHRTDGVTVANNIFKNNTITIQQSALASSNFVGIYTPSGKYPVYFGSYTDGAWPVFANGNKFINTTFLNSDGSAYDMANGTAMIGYYYGTGGFGKTIAQAYADYPDVFYNDSDATAPSAPSSLSVL